jgi:hypothetical protein
MAATMAAAETAPAKLAAVGTAATEGMAPGESAVRTATE